jgi:hypothetical protein
VRITVEALVYMSLIKSVKVDGKPIWDRDV